ncbi:hypothetical protein ACJRO7_000212 [Eucalyptus globulus]|uniref:CCHC-type domain-containing protein n=1 Tax=Eucalyptus globulus TaxID=34317 RepID=A0ABD3LLV3_EUCGL
MENRKADPRLELLCKRLGDMWSEDDIIDLEELDTSEQEKDCKLMLIGKLFTSPSVNFQAFQSTMKKAWKLDNVNITLLEQGHFLFTFKSTMDIKRVLDGGPWSFANHILLLKPWEPNTPPRCYDFTKGTFWVHLYGLPVEWRNERAVRKIARELGNVIEIKTETKNSAPFAFERVKVELDLSTPLKQGSVIKRARKFFWVEYKYERLPHYCYACGKLGHYTTHCTEIQVDENKMDNLRFGFWLKAEAKEFSPIWKLFYEENWENRTEDEIIPETQVLSNQMEIVQPACPHPSHKDRTEKRKEMDSKTSRGNEASSNPPFLLLTWPDKGKAPMSNTGISYAETNQKAEGKRGKTGAKKQKRYNPYAPEALQSLIDEDQLLETPVKVNGEVQWALVASPNKPPGYQ